MMSRALPEKGIVILVLSLSIAASGCQQLRFPQPQEATSAASQDAPPEKPKTVEAAPAPEALPSEHWTTLAAKGRASFRANNMEESEKAYLASLKATSGFEAYDVRVTTALDNLARIAAYYQKRGEYEKAAPIVDVVARNASEGRKAEFESAGPPLLRQAITLSTDKQYEAAIRLNRLALTLLGVDQTSNQAESLSARWNLADGYIESGQTGKAEEQIKILRERLDRIYGPESPQATSLWVQVGRIQVANGDIASAETSYLKVIDAEQVQKDRKIEALELYIDLLEGSDRSQEAGTRKRELKKLAS